MTFKEWTKLDKQLAVWALIVGIWSLASIIMGYGYDIDLNPWLGNFGESTLNIMLFLIGSFVIIYRDSKPHTMEDYEPRSIMNKDKKGQAVMEFLLTYGWAILVVLLCIGIMAYHGVLNPKELMKGLDVCAADETCDSLCGAPLSDGYQDCMNGIIEMQAREVCSNLVTLAETGQADYWAYPAFIDDVEELEVGYKVRIQPLQESEMFHFDIDELETGERVLLGVECRTESDICLRACDPKNQSGCFCNIVDMRTYVSGSRLDMIMDEMGIGD